MVSFKLLARTRIIQKMHQVLVIFHNQSTYDLIKSLELNRDWQAGLKRCSENNGLSFCLHLVIWTRLIVWLLLMFVRISHSFDLIDDDLIGYIASRKKPLILSTGLANLAEIQFAVNAAHKMKNKDIALLQCTSLYLRQLYLI